MSLWGRQVSAAMDARTSISDISPLLVLEFWRDNHLLDVTAEDVGSNSQPLNAWYRHHLNGITVPDGTTQIRVIGLAHITRTGTIGSACSSFVLEDGATAGPYVDTPTLSRSPLPETGRW